MSHTAACPSFGKREADDLLVWLGPPFFSAHLEQSGWRIVRADHSLPILRNWDDILALADGVPPKVLVVADGSQPPAVIGMERFPCITVFYSVDSHIHSWHSLYGQAFDLCLISLRDQLSSFYRKRLPKERIRWSPPHARDEFRPGDTPPDKEWDLIFAGTVNPEFAPKRCAFLDEVKKAFPGLHITGVSFPLVYPKARLILNECTYGELNFRVFEALGCGGCLLTPDIGPSVTELFADGKELFLYPPYNVPTLLERVHTLLADARLRQQATLAGLAAVDARHRASHRAQALDELLRPLLASGEAGEIIRQRLSASTAIHREILRFIYLLHAESMDVPALREAYLAAYRGA